MSASADPLILASGSPRRLELLRSLGLEPVVIPSDVEEIRREGEDPRDYVRRLAVDKARAVARHNGGSWVMAADTVVVLDGEVLEKPADSREAVEMLTRLAGSVHTVFTGVCLTDGREFEETAVEATAVKIATMERSRIEWYVGTGEPMDKAGAYAIQGLGAIFVESIDGNYTNVVGLPIPVVARMMDLAGISPAGG